MWLQLRDRDLRSKEEQLGCCLVGQWGEKTTSFPDLALLRRWRLKEGVSFSNLGGGRFLAKFNV